MPSFFWVAIVLFVVLDVAMVLFFVNRVRSGLSGQFGPGFANLAGGTGLMGLLSFLRSAATELDRTIVEHLQANYSGQKEQLPQALLGAVERARTFASSRNVTVNDEALRALVIQIVVSHKLASRADAIQALHSVSATPPPVE